MDQSARDLANEVSVVRDVEADTKGQVQVVSSDNDSKPEENGKEEEQVSQGLKRLKSTGDEQ